MSEDNVRGMWSDDELDTALTTLRSDVDTDRRLLARARTELLVGAGAPEPAPARTEAVEPGRRAWRRWVVPGAAAAAVAVVATVVVVVRTPSADDNPPVAHAAAAKELNVAADRVDAIDARDEPLGPGQYRYVAEHAWWMSTTSPGGDTYMYLAENVLETWIPREEKDVWLWRRDVTGKRKWIQGSEQAARAAGVDVGGSWPEGEWRARCGDWFAEEEGREPACQEGSWQTPNQEFIASLPRDPDALHDVMRAATAGRGQAPDSEMLVYTADILRTGLVPADLRAALYRVLAKVPSVEVTEKVANLDGRKGTAFSVVVRDDLRVDLIIDPATGLFIGERSVTLEDGDGIPAGTVVELTSVVTGVADGMGEKPAG